MNVKLDKTSHDWVVENNQLALVTGKDEIEQIIKTRLLTLLGEWFLDVNIGIPYYQQILVKQPNSQAIEAIFINEITASPGITELKSLDLSIDNATRRLRVTFLATSVDGIIDFSEVL